jgi:hypothetical protein
VHTKEFDKIDVGKVPRVLMASESSDSNRTVTFHDPLQKILDDLLFGSELVGDLLVALGLHDAGKDREGSLGERRGRELVGLPTRRHNAKVSRFETQCPIWCPCIFLAPLESAIARVFPTNSQIH